MWCDHHNIISTTLDAWGLGVQHQPWHQAATRGCWQQADTGILTGYADHLAVSASSESESMGSCHMTERRRLGGGTLRQEVGTSGVSCCCSFIRRHLPCPCKRCAPISSKAEYPGSEDAVPGWCASPDTSDFMYSADSWSSNVVLNLHNCARLRPNNARNLKQPSHTLCPCR